MAIPKSHHALGIGCLTVIGVFVLVIALGSSWGGDDAVEDSPELRKAGAEVACRDYVSDRLKAPTSADFSATSSRAVSDVEFVVSGEVDAQNSFGATLRSRYSCTVRLNIDSSTWALLNLSIT